MLKFLELIAAAICLSVEQFRVGQVVTDIEKERLVPATVMKEWEG